MQLLLSVDELKESTNKVREYARKIELLSTEFEALRKDTVTNEKLTELRLELRKLQVLFSANARNTRRLTTWNWPPRCEV